MTQASPRPGFLAGARSFALGSAFGMVASVVRVLLAARLLSALEASVWLGLQVILGYGQHAHFGVLFGMLRNVPIYRSQAKLPLAQGVSSTAFGWVLFTTAIASLGMLPFSRSYLALSFPTAALGTALLAVSLLRAYYITLYKAEARHAFLGKVSALGGLVGLATLPLIVVMKVQGLIMGTALQYAFECLYLALCTPWIGGKVQAPLLVQQMRTGLMTLAGALLATLLASLDRTVMLELCGQAGTGLYYLGANVKTMAPMIIGLPFAVITPRVFERFGRGDTLLPTVSLPTRSSTFLLSPLLAATACFVDPIVGTFFPNLRGGELATIVALATCLHVVLAGFPVNVFYAHDRQLPQVLILGVAVAIAAACAIAGAKLGFGITGVALGASVGGIFYFAALTIASYRLMNEPVREAVQLVNVTLLPSLALFGLLLAVREALLQQPFNPWLRGVLTLIVVALPSPLFLRAGLLHLRAMRQLS